MENIKQRREEFDQLGKLYPNEPSVHIEKTDVKGVSCYWFTPGKVIANRIIIYLHGGVYALGSVQSHGSLVSHIAHKLKTKILFVEYALAPERPYPAANEDVFSVYTSLLNDYPGYDVGFIGDSAGGGLIITVAGDLLKRQLPLPDAAVMISPWISLKSDNPSQEMNRAKDPILTREVLKGAAKEFLGNAAIETASPHDVVLTQFPRVLITVGTNEILLDDSVNFYNAVKKIQPDSTLTIYQNQQHVWPLADISSEASQQLLTEMDVFFNK